jgi:hypothetical protein
MSCFKPVERLVASLSSGQAKKLIDLSRNQLLLMEGKVLDGETYLFIEAGGFTTGQPKDYYCYC